MDGKTAQECIVHLFDRLPAIEHLGDVALVAWTVAELRHELAQFDVEHSQRLLSPARHPLTVAVAWALSALLATYYQEALAP